jgi:Domain of unknown function DUF11
VGLGRRWGLATITVVAAAVPASAGAITVGAVAGSDPGTCKSINEAVFLAQTASSGPSYAVPSGGGLITSWQTSYGSSGAFLSMVVLRVTANPALYTVVGSDSETLPSPISANHISSFAPASPILVQAGDIVGLQIPSSSETACFYEGGIGDVFFGGPAGSLSPGASLEITSAAEKGRVNVEANLTQTVDLSLTQAISPATGGPGVALISLTPGGPGPGGIPATVTDIVPGGLSVLGAGLSGHGSCSVAGQTVTCSLAAVPLNAVPVIDIAVSSTTSGSYTNEALLTPVITDSNPANNAAAATLTVTAPNAPTKCTVIALKGARVSLAETVLKALHCHIGKVKKVASKTVRKGLVVSTSLKPGATAAADTSVGINVSSGKPKKKHH